MKFHKFAGMIKQGVIICVVLVFLGSCYNPPRKCEDFKEGTFRFTSLIDGEEQTTVFERNGSIEIDYFKGKADTSSIRWINSCEYVVKKINPRSKAEEKAIHMKIISTTDSSYVFEYGLVGSANKSKGTAIKVK